MKITLPFNVQQILRLFSGPQSSTWGSLVAVLRQTHQALQGNLSFGDNVIGQFSTITVSTAVNYAYGHFSPVIVPWNFGAKKNPQSVMVGQIQNTSNQYPLLSAQSVQWTYNETDETVIINYISGLNNLNTYTITLEIK